MDDSNRILYDTTHSIAKQFQAFKVETVGDCYVAVTGCPEPMKDHALVMARFAWECSTTMGQFGWQR